MQDNQKNGAFFDQFTQFVLRYRWSLFVLLVVISAFVFQQALRVRVDFTVQELFAVNDPGIEYLNEFRKQYGADDDLIVLLIQAEDVFHPKVLRLVKKLTRRIRRLDDVRKVESLTTLPDLGGDNSGVIDTRALFHKIPNTKTELLLLKERALKSTLLAKHIVAVDGTLTVIAVNMAHGIERAKDVERVIKSIETLVAQTRLPNGVKITLSGIPYVRTEAVRSLRGDQLSFLPLSVLINGIILLFLYRSFHGILIPLVAIGLSTIYTVGLMALLGGQLDIISNILPLFVMVYGVGDAIHLLSRMHEQMRKGDTCDLAIRMAVRHLGIACFLTSATTAVGFGSLFASSMSILRRFGLYAALGVMVAYVVTMLVVPLSVKILGVKSEKVKARTQLIFLDRILSAISCFVIRRPKTLFVIGILLGLAGILIGSRVPVNHYVLGVFKDDHPSAIATRLAEEKLQGVISLQVGFSGKPGIIKEPKILEGMSLLQTWLEKQPEVTGTISPATFVMEMHRAVLGTRKIPNDRAAIAQLLLMVEGETGLEKFVDYQYGKARILISLRDTGTQVQLALFDRVENQVKKIFASLPIEARITGTSIIAVRGINQLVTDLFVSLSMALVIIAVILIGVFRSVKVGLISLIPNVIPLAAGLWFMGVTGMHLEPATVMIFSIALGIAVDDTIHFIARFREERYNGIEAEGAVRNALLNTGRAMIFTSVILVLGFLIILVSDFPATQRFGILGCVILFTALIADLFITPACMLLLRPWKCKL